MTQWLWESPTPPAVNVDFWRTAYQASDSITARLSDASHSRVASAGLCGDRTIPPRAGGSRHVCRLLLHVCLCTRLGAAWSPLWKDGVWQGHRVPQEGWVSALMRLWVACLRFCCGRLAVNQHFGHVVPPTKRLPSSLFSRTMGEVRRCRFGLKAAGERLGITTSHPRQT
jgi:hypothetical protein